MGCNVLCSPVHMQRRFRRTSSPTQSGLPEDFSISSFGKWELILTSGHHHISKARNRHSSPCDNL